MSYQAPPVRYVPATSVALSLPAGPPGLPAKPPVTVPPVEYNYSQHQPKPSLLPQNPRTYKSVSNGKIQLSLAPFDASGGPPIAQASPPISAPTPQPDAVLPLPSLQDALDAFQTTMSALAHLCYNGRNIAAATGYKACPVQERDSEKKVLQEMSPAEADAYTDWKSRTMLSLPSMNWDTDHAAPPTGDTSNSAKSLKIAKKRAHALNRLYDTNRADAGHAVYWAQKFPERLPLLKAITRIVGAEVAATGGNENLNSEEWAELQTLGKIISIGSQYMQKQVKHSAAKKFINGNLQVLIARRQQLQNKVSGTNPTKRKAGSNSHEQQPDKRTR